VPQHTLCNPQHPRHPTPTLDTQDTNCQTHSTRTTAEAPAHKQQVVSAKDSARFTQRILLPLALPAAPLDSTVRPSHKKMNLHRIPSNAGKFVHKTVSRHNRTGPSCHPMQSTLPEHAPQLDTTYVHICTTCQATQAIREWFKTQQDCPSCHPVKLRLHEHAAQQSHLSSCMQNLSMCGTRALGAT
jgi:hypothetical protein